ncbi:hypothetical protein OS965_02260 [Streptomyces sp. H27-G5]|uniref:hypothetical protein n=1 Tax=Streptomyces sp. H27-G5 TaxID=2996698 RepID=UPI00226D8A73|nr:hypothetical protein [Streptomyces sp. H27-G5]MCY0916999.1 hypothetical protein [Streptomyces sp. H27-G5]
MTAADDLQAAATRLRDLAAEASPAPWTANRWGNVETAGFEEVAEVWPLQAKPHVNVDYIAAMHPGVGAVLAELLDYAAQYARLYDSLLGRTASDPHPEAQTRHLLAVARAILGTDGSSQ